MNRLKNILIASVFSLFCNCSFAQKAFINTSNWNHILKMAKVQHKNIFIYAFNSDNQASVKNQDEVFSNERIVNILDKDFISIKINLDNYVDNNSLISKLLRKHKLIQSNYLGSIFPICIFLSPEGKFIHKESGFKNANTFIEILTAVEIPNVSFTEKLIEYRQGKLNNGEIKKLCLRAKNYQFKPLSEEIGKRFIKKVFADSASASRLLKENVDFIREFISLFKIDDSITRFIYLNQVESDQITRITNFSSSYLNNVISYHYFGSFLRKTTKLNKMYEPDWQLISKQVSHNFDPSTASRIILLNQIYYYSRIEDWARLIECKIKQIDSEIQDLTNPYVRASINSMVFNIFFKHSSNEEHLKKGIAYMEKIMPYSQADHRIIDTYANILYKSNQKKKAIAQERLALQLAEKYQDFEDVKYYQGILNMMERDLPTWSTEVK